jgi:hypothetical protein
LPQSRFSFDPGPRRLRWADDMGDRLLDPISFLAGVVLGAALHAAVAPTVRKLTGGYFFREGGKAIDEGIGIDSPGV